MEVLVRRTAQFTNVDGLPVAIQIDTVFMIQRCKRRERTGPKPENVRIVDEVTVINFETSKGSLVDVTVKEDYEAVKATIWPPLH